MIRVLYLAHDLSDAAIWRRVQMLRAGGAEVDVCGFRRGDYVTPEGVSTIDLGVTENARLTRRALSVLRARTNLGRKLAGLPQADVILARNLEMLALAPIAAARMGDAPVVYECLDIHRMMLRTDRVGRLMRWIERRLGRSVALLWTSSPGFLRNYFDRYQTLDCHSRLIENRFLELDDAPEPEAGPSGGPIRIGWYGILRCRRSLRTLDAISRQAAGRIEIVLRGKPAYDELPDFDQTVAENPHMTFAGAYRYPDDLAGLYGDVHFAWLVDWYDAGQNSEWLLPNRLYEGCRFGAVPIARGETEIARFLDRRGLGLVLNDAEPGAVTETLLALTDSQLKDLRGAVARAGRETWSCGPDACRALVADLARVSSATPRALQTGEVGG